MAHIGDRIRLRMTALNLTQAQTAELSGISQGIISRLINGKQKDLSSENLRDLATALEVPMVYFLTNSPQEYLAARLATRSAEELTRWDDMGLHERVNWVLSDLEMNWGPEYGMDALVSATRISQASVKLMLAGRAQITPYMLRTISILTGVPTTVFTGDPGGLPVYDLPPKVLEVAETVEALGLDPDYVQKLLVLIAERPELNVPERPKGKSKGPEQ